MLTNNGGRCAVDGCQRQPTSTVVGALCAVHYHRVYRTGTLDAKLDMTRADKCAWCGKELPAHVTKGGNCGGTCRDRLDYRRVKHRIATEPGYRAKYHANNTRQRLRRKAQTTTVEPIDPLDIFARDNWTCQQCGQPVDAALKWPDPMSKSLDHIRPLSKGGAHVTSNVRLTHLGCNCSKQAWYMSEADYHDLASRMVEAMEGLFAHAAEVEKNEPKDRK